MKVEGFGVFVFTHGLGRVSAFVYYHYDGR